MASAMFSIADTDGLRSSPTRMLFTEGGSPEHQIPYLADFYLLTITQHRPLTLESFLTYAAHRPGSLPTRLIARGESAGQVADYHYRLTLSANNHGLRLLVSPGVRETGPQLPDPITQGNIFTVAAAMCELLADRTQRYADNHDGFVVPGDEPERWLARAETYRDSHRRFGAADGASLSTTYLPPTFDTPHPALHVAGAYVFAYIHRDGHLQVSVDLDDTEEWLTRGDGTVPMRISIQGDDVLTG
jgi:hypothetical protein